MDQKAAINHMLGAMLDRMRVADEDKRIHIRLRGDGAISAAGKAGILTLQEEAEWQEKFTAAMFALPVKHSKRK